MVLVRIELFFPAKIQKLVLCTQINQFCQGDRTRWQVGGCWQLDLASMLGRRDGLAHLQASLNFSLNHTGSDEMAFLATVETLIFWHASLLFSQG